MQKAETRLRYSYEVSSLAGLGKGTIKAHTEAEALQEIEAHFRRHGGLPEGMPMTIKILKVEP